jgi:hypothetical protein
MQTKNQQQNRFAANEKNPIKSMSNIPKTLLRKHQIECLYTKTVAVLGLFFCYELLLAWWTKKREEKMKFTIENCPKTNNKSKNHVNCSLLICKRCATAAWIQWHLRISEPGFLSSSINSFFFSSICSDKD